MSIAQAWELIGLISAFIWNLITSFEIFGILIYPFVLFGIAMSFLSYLASKIIQRKAGQNGDSD